jgi:hypothetical protein
MTKTASVVLPLAFFAGMNSSCSGGPQEAVVAEPYRIYLDPTSAKNDEPFPTLSEMVDEIEYIKLEYAPDLPVGTIYDFSAIPIITDDYIIISDRDQGVLQYSRDGKFLRRIGHIGRGPGEYRGGCNILADKERDVVYIINMGNVIGYELATGKLLEEVSIAGLDDDLPPFMWGPMSPVLMSDSLWFMSQGNAGVFLSSKTDVYSWHMLEVPTMRIARSKRSWLFDNPPAGDFVVNPTPTWRDPEGRVNFYENLADTIFVVNTDGSTIPRIIPDFGPGKLSSPALPTTDIVVESVKENGRYILFEERYKFQRHMISFDKVTGERGLHPKRIPVGTTDNFWGPANDIDGGFSRFRQYDENIWWASYDAYEILDKLTPEHFENMRENVKYPDRLSKLQSHVNSLKENDNPVVVIAKLKK